MLKRTLVAAAAVLTLNAASAATLTPIDIFNWVEKDFSEIFPPGAVTNRINFGGFWYTYRYYNTNGGVYIGMREDNERIYTFNVVAPGLVDHGHIDNHKCYARPDLCGAATFAGTLMFSADGSGTSVTLSANYRSGKLWGVGADGKGFEIPVAKIDALCAHSIRLANWDRSTGLGCSKPAANGELKITGLPNNDCSRFTAWSEGKEYWLDLGSATGWRFTGLNAKLNASCGIEYGPRGFQAAKVYSVREPDNTATLVWDFGSDFFAGFFGRDGQSIRLEAGKVYAFALNGERQGKNYASGWGLGDNRKTSAGDKIEPSIRMAWLEPVDGRLVLKFKGLACSDKVNVTVYAGTGPANNVVYDFASDGFGLGWAGLPYRDGVSLWTAGDGVSFDRDKGQVQYAVPFCTQK